jgi:hypothetical protein
MADQKKGDTWPPLRGVASDEDGLIDLTQADYTLFYMKFSSTLISGTAIPIDPPDEDGFNWEYTWQDGDTDIVGTYVVELEVHWDDSSDPPKVETVPKSNENPVVVVYEDQD